MKTAVIYARYSSDNQTEQSIEGQLRVCEEYAAKNNIVVIDTYIDRAMTGTNDNRPDFQRMIRDSAKKTFGYVLVYKFDRFSRNKYETAIHKKALQNISPTARRRSSLKVCWKAMRSITVRNCRKKSNAG